MKNINCLAHLFMSTCILGSSIFSDAFAWAGATKTIPKEGGTSAGEKKSKDPGQDKDKDEDKDNTSSLHS